MCTIHGLGPVEYLERFLGPCRDGTSSVSLCSLFQSTSVVLMWHSPMYEPIKWLLKCSNNSRLSFLGDFKRITLGPVEVCPPSSVRLRNNRNGSVERDLRGYKCVVGTFNHFTFRTLEMLVCLFQTLSRVIKELWHLNPSVILPCRFLY